MLFSAGLHAYYFIIKRGGLMLNKPSWMSAPDERKEDRVKINSEVHFVYKGRFMKGRYVDFSELRDCVGVLSIFACGGLHTWPNFLRDKQADRRQATGRQAPLSPKLIHHAIS